MLFGVKFGYRIGIVSFRINKVIIFLGPDIFSRIVRVFRVITRILIGLAIILVGVARCLAAGAFWLVVVLLLLLGAFLFGQSFHTFSFTQSFLGRTGFLIRIIKQSIVIIIITVLVRI